MSNPQTNRQRAFAKLAKLRDSGLSDELILEEILANVLSGDAALDAVEAVAETYEELISEKG